MFRSDRQRKAMFANMNSFSSASSRLVREDSIAALNSGTESILDAYKGGYLSVDDLEEANALGLVSDPVYTSLKRGLDSKKSEFSNGGDFTSGLDVRRKQLTKMYDEGGLDLKALGDSDKRILMGVLQFRSEVNDVFGEEAMLADIRDEIEHDKVMELAGEYEFTSENVELGRVAHEKIKAQGLDAKLTKDETEAHFVYMRLLDELQK